MSSFSPSVDMATVSFPDGTHAFVPFYILYKSPVLYESLTYARASVGHDVVIHAPRTFFHDWLESAEMLSKLPTTSLGDAEPEQLLRYLLVRSISSPADGFIVNGLNYFCPWEGLS
jgi:hypothetical protein